MRGITNHGYFVDLLENGLAILATLCCEQLHLQVLFNACSLEESVRKWEPNPRPSRCLGFYTVCVLRYVP